MADENFAYSPVTHSASTVEVLACAPSFAFAMQEPNVSETKLTTCPGAGLGAGPGAGLGAGAVHAAVDDILTVIVLSGIESVTESMVYGDEVSCEHWIKTWVVNFESVFVKVKVTPSFDPAP